MSYVTQYEQRQQISMSEYKIKLKATVPGLFFNHTAEGVEIVEAESAKEAIEKVKLLDDYVRYEEYITIADVEKL